MKKIVTKISLGILCGLIMSLLIGALFTDMSNDEYVKAINNTYNSSPMETMDNIPDAENELDSKREKEEARILEKERVARERYRKESIEVERREKEFMEREIIVTENEKAEEEEKLDIPEEINRVSESEENILTIIDITLEN